MWLRDDWYFYSLSFLRMKASPKKKRRVTWQKLNSSIHQSQCRCFQWAADVAAAAAVDVSADVVAAADVAAVGVAEAHSREKSFFFIFLHPSSFFLFFCCYQFFLIVAFSSSTSCLYQILLSFLSHWFLLKTQIFIFTTPPWASTPSFFPNIALIYMLATPMALLGFVPWFLSLVSLGTSHLMDEESPSIKERESAHGKEEEEKKPEEPLHQDWDSNPQPQSPEPRAQSTRPLIFLYLCVPFFLFCLISKSST